MTTPTQQQDAEIRRMVEGLKWPLDFGSVKVQIRGGKPALVTIERTIKLD